MRLDQLPQTQTPKPAELAKPLEHRLLVFATSEHTETGRHAKILTAFAAWQARVGLSDSELPDTESALEALTAAVRAWVGERAAGLLPWLPALPRKRAREGRP